MSASCSLFLTACSNDDDNWTPGPSFDVVDQVYFVGSNVKSEEINVGEASKYDIVVSRSKSNDAITVPLKVTADQGFSAPSEVKFEAGELQKTISVEFAGAQSAGYANCEISIPDGSYSSPYTKYNSSYTISLLVAKWNKIADLYGAYYYHSSFWPEDYAPSLWQLEDETNTEGEELFCVRGLFVDTNFTFKLKNAVYSDGSPRTLVSAYIDPQGGGKADEDPFGWGYKAWCFYNQMLVDNFDYDDPDTWCSLTFPGLEQYLFYNPFIINDSTYSQPYIDMANKYISMFLCFSLYTEGWVYDSSVYYEYLYLCWN